MRGLKIFMIAALMMGCGSLSAAEKDDEKPKPPEVGKRPPDFELPVVGGQDFVQLSDEYKKGPVAVVVLRGYPGYQCPLCSSQVSSLINRARALGEKAHRVILVYPGQGTPLQRHAEQFLGSRSLPDPLIMVRDDDLAMVSEWGLRWDSPRETAYPSAFVIDGNGRVKWRKISDNHAGRASAEDLLRELRRK